MPNFKLSHTTSSLTPSKKLKAGNAIAVQSVGQVLRQGRFGIDHMNAFPGKALVFLIGTKCQLALAAMKEEDMAKTRYVGLDIHAETIAVATAYEGRNGEVRFYGTIKSNLLN